MKHIALHHPISALQGALGRRASRGHRSTWAAAATTVSVAVARHFPSAPSRSARPQPARAPARPSAVDLQQAASAAAAPAGTAASRWQRQGMRAVSWVEGLVLAVLIAFFGGGLAAILGGF
jgi:hypothetical protein